MSDYDESPELLPHERLAPELEAELAEALRAAFHPAPLDPERQRELVALALDDPFAPPTEDELRESERLRRALDEGDDSHPDAALARAVRAAALPSALRPELATKGRSRGNVIYASFGAIALAAAAGFALFVLRPQAKQAAPVAAQLAPRPGLAQSRTTTALFEAPFEPGETTARIDRIAASRGRDLRENLYAKWGVR